jgi:hypothetical protein
MACNGYFILAKLLEDPKQIKRPLFLTCVITWIAHTIGFGFLTKVAHWKSTSPVINADTIADLVI